LEFRFFSPFPKYLQIREILLRRIEREFDIGDRFPTDQVLCEEFGVSRETVREALSGLTRDGLISRRRGRGTFVTKHPEPKMDTRQTGLVEDFSALKLDTEARVLEKGPINPPRGVASTLDLDSDEPVYRIMRLRMFEGRPWRPTRASCPWSMVSGSPSWIFDTRPSSTNSSIPSTSRFGTTSSTSRQ
jgi:GntR family transcriptional regulator